MPMKQGHKLPGRIGTDLTPGCATGGCKITGTRIDVRVYLRVICENTNWEGTMSEYLWGNNSGRIRFVR